MTHLLKFFSHEKISRIDANGNLVTDYYNMYKDTTAVEMVYLWTHSITATRSMPKDYRLIDDDDWNNRWATKYGEVSSAIDKKSFKNKNQ